MMCNQLSMWVGSRSLLWPAGRTSMQPAKARTAHAAHENIRLKSRPHSPMATHRSLPASWRSALRLSSLQLCTR